MQAWDFVSLPRAWMPMLRWVDEIWAYSRPVRDCYLEAGFPPEQVHVISLGIDPEVSRPGLEPLPMAPGPNLRLLFVGGKIFCKGIDPGAPGLAAFAWAFQPSDGIGLVIKDMGSERFHRGQTAGAQVAATSDR